jgi:cyclopropane fatty-acyl-phospholipid synthase-like methyltransferase
MNTVAMTKRLCETCGGSEFRHLFTRNAQNFSRCRSCRLVRIDPQPTDEVLAAIYSGKYFDAWGVQTDADQVLKLKKDTFRKNILGTVALKPGARVLDCGAAFGALMDVAAEAGLEPYGIELVGEAAAAIARRFGPDRVFSGPFEQASFPCLGDKGFDAVFMCDFIEHVRDPLAVLKKASNLLHPEGWLVITTPDGGSPSCRIMGASWPHYNVEHLYCFSRGNLANILLRAGFTVVHYRAARKVVTLEYICHHLKARPRPLITGAVRLLARCVSRRAANWQASFALGQMLVVAAKMPSAPDSDRNGSKPVATGSVMG